MILYPKKTVIITNILFNDTLLTEAETCKSLKKDLTSLCWLYSRQSYRKKTQKPRVKNKI
ncbi:MAG TPA: hypothetical protein DCZ23_00385 [Lachnospiraceae bacterium]|nr:hypothetical protein [Lachnospiraceae bacterium]